MRLKNAIIIENYASIRVVFFFGGACKNFLQRVLEQYTLQKVGFFGAGQHSGSAKNLNDAAGVARSIFMIFIFYNQF